MSDDDPELEAFLRGFRPRAPRPLPSPRLEPPASATGWMVAAAVLCAVGGLMATGGRAVAPLSRVADVRPPATVGVLGAALREGRLEAVLDAMNRRALPNPMQPGGALAVVGDVNRDR